MFVRLVSASLALALASAPAAFAEPFKVSVDQTVALKIAAPANSVVVGNEAVADVAVHDPHTILITGKSFGSTNLMVLNDNGDTIYANLIAVSAGAVSELTIVRGPDSYSYSCIDKCRETKSTATAVSGKGQ
jgi:Flp pilus assembly secretin CpaC